MGCPSRAAVLGKRRQLLVLTACVTLTLLLWPWVTMLASAGYAYAWWLKPELHYAAPGAPPAKAGARDSGGVPKIIHQTWQTAEVPAKWAAARQSCVDLHPDYEHHLWTDAEGLEFIQEHYPWFLPTYQSYLYAIQRVDVLRYFILLHYGGIYIDLDMGCRQRLDFLRWHNFTAPLTNPVGISNDVMAARPGDAYLAYAVHRLSSWNRWLGIKYIQVMFSTGPMFLTVQYSLFPNRADVGVIPRDVYGKYEVPKDGSSPAFYHLHGSSWHANDAQFIFWLQKHEVLLTVLGALLLAGLAGLALLRCLLPHRYHQVKSEE